MHTKLRSLVVLTAVIGLIGCAETQSVNPDPEEEVAADTSAADDGVQDTALAADVVEDATAADVVEETAAADDVQDAAGEVPDALDVDTTPCSPNCEGKVCGSDGCGGDCGTCEPGQGCNGSGQCGSKQITCTPDCVPCKACTSQEDCSESEICQVVMAGSYCLTTCLTDSDCALGESCIGNTCTPFKSCAPKECGPDGCGGICGECDEGSICSSGKCNSGAEEGCGDIPAGVGCCDGDTHKVCEFLSVKTTDCAELGFTCGWNNLHAMYSCGFEGSSPLPQYPKQCGEVCVPDCEGKGCGTDGCGGSCGECAEGEVCSDESMCCSPNCEGKSCGESDGCGGTCTACPEGEICRDDTNVCCKPCCEGKECGGNCCGGNCGECPLPLHFACQDYKCKSTPCGTKPKGCCFGAGFDLVATIFFFSTTVLDLDAANSDCFGLDAAGLGSLLRIGVSFFFVFFDCLS